MEKHRETMIAPEQETGHENEQYTSQVLLHLERHGDKAGDILSETGKKQLFEKGKTRGHAEPTAVAIGGPLERAQHSAALDMSGAEGTADITGTESLEELRNKLDAAAGRKVGSRIGVDERLGFDVGGPEFKAPLVKAFGEKKGLAWLVNESDQLAVQYHDAKGLTYTKAAGSIAGVVEKYIDVEKKFHAIVSDQKKREQYGDTLERFLGSHGGVVDSFLCKVVEKMKGTAERDKLVEALGHGAGFDTAEGMDIKINSAADGQEPQVRIAYTKNDPEGNVIFEFNEIIPHQLIQDIIEEDKALTESIETAP